IFGIAFTRVVEGRARLIVYYGHASSFRVSTDAEAFFIHTHSVVVRNSGRRVANNVRLGHAVLPINYNLYPDTRYDLVELPAGSKEIVIPQLLPGEQITVSYLYYPPLTWDQTNSYVKSDEGGARVITMLPQQQYPRWFNAMAAAMMIAGVVATTYLLVIAVRWLLPQI